MFQSIVNCILLYFFIFNSKWLQKTRTYTSHTLTHTQNNKHKQTITPQTADLSTPANEGVF